MKNYKQIFATFAITLSLCASAANVNDREARSGEVLIHCASYDSNELQFNKRFLPDDLTSGIFNENDTLVGYVHFRKAAGIIVSAPSISRIVNQGTEICVTITKK